MGFIERLRIFTGSAEINEFRSDIVQGEDWYLRAMRAHANCLENLPVFGAVIFALYVSGVSVIATDAMAGIVLVSRIFQSIIHVALTQTNVIAFIRFVLFFTQPVCFIGITSKLLVNHYDGVF